MHLAALYTRTAPARMAYVHSAIEIPSKLTLVLTSSSGSVNLARNDRQNGRRRIVVIGGETMPEGKLQKFKSGATSSEMLPPYDLMTKAFLTRTAKRLGVGAEKHGRFNYRKGLKDREFIMDRLNHAFLHLKNAMDQIENGEVMEDDDLSAVAVNVMMAMEYQEANGLGPSNK